MTQSKVPGPRIRIRLGSFPAGHFRLSHSVRGIYPAVCAANVSNRQRDCSVLQQIAALTSSGEPPVVRRKKSIPGCILSSTGRQKDLFRETFISRRTHGFEET